jgi:hypothetical protein
VHKNLLFFFALLTACSHDYVHRHPTEDLGIPSDIQAKAPEGVTAQYLSKDQVAEFTAVFSELNARLTFLSDTEVKFIRTMQAGPGALQLALKNDQQLNSKLYVTLVDAGETDQLSHCLSHQHQAPESDNHIQILLPGDSFDTLFKQLVNGPSCPIQVTRDQWVNLRMMTSDKNSNSNSTSSLKGSDSLNFKIASRKRETGFQLTLSGPDRETPQTQQIYRKAEVKLTHTSPDLNVTLQCQVELLNSTDNHDNSTQSASSYQCQLTNTQSGNVFYFQGNHKRADELNQVDEHWLGSKSYSSDDWSALANSFFIDLW